MPRASHLAAVLLLAAGASTAAAQEGVAVLEVDGESVKLNQGRQDGVQIGQVYDLYEEREVYYLPLTMGEVPLVLAQQKVATVLVFHVEPTTARATVVERRGAVVAGLRALLDPNARPPNRPPRFVSKPEPQPIIWRQRQRLAFQVSNERDEHVVYTWSTTGGYLAHERTLSPVNTWVAPPAEGDYDVDVSARDRAGNVTHARVKVASRGIPRGARLGKLTPQRQLGATSRYKTIKDFAFDDQDRRYVLHRARGGIFSSGRLSVLVEFANRGPIQLPADEWELSALAVANPQRDRPGVLYALDADTRTVIRFPFGGPWGQVLKQEPALLGDPEGGAGNARFLQPVDLALSPEGEVYVLDAEQRCVQAFSEEGEFLVSFGQPGDGELRLKAPTALAVGPDGRVYVLDDGRKAVVVYDRWRPVSEFTVGAEGEEGERLTGIAVDPYTGVVHVLEKRNGWIKRYAEGRLSPPHYTPESNTIDRLVGPTRLRMSPQRVLWVADQEGRSAVRIDAESMDFLGRTGGIEFSGRLRIAATPEGGVAALDRGDYQVTLFDREGWILARFGGEGDVSGKFLDPVDVAVGRTGDVFVLDAEKQQIFAFSRRGRFLQALGRPGRGQTQLERPVDLNLTPDREYLVVLQQRADANFTLIHPGTGVPAGGWGIGYEGELTPRFGCVTGIDGEVDGAEAEKAYFWTARVDREVIERTRGAQAPGGEVDPSVVFDEITDLEPSVAGWVFVCDEDLDQVVAFGPDGTILEMLPEDGRLGSPWDLGVDDYGRVYVYDHSARRIIQLAE